MIVIQGHSFKETPIDSLHAEKIAEAALLYLFKIVFPASFLVSVRSSLIIDHNEHTAGSSV